MPATKAAYVACSRAGLVLSGGHQFLEAREHVRPMGARPVDLAAVRTLHKFLMRACDIGGDCVIQNLLGFYGRGFKQR